MKITRKLLLIVVLTCYLIIGSIIVRKSVAAQSISWMNIYRLSDFANITLSELVIFFKELRIPIPPVIGFSEILSFWIIGSNALVTKYLYRIGLVCGYMIAIIFANKSITRLFASFFISVLFIYETKIIHRSNPIIYDILLPFFFLLFLFLINIATSKDTKFKNKILVWVLTFLSGFFLSMTELSRPFVVYIMPLLILSSYFMIKRSNLKYQFLVFIFPIILFSGFWHLHLYINLDQITFSNHSGFNLSRAWNLKSVDLIPEKNNTPLYEGGWENLNTIEHSINNEILQNAVFDYWLENPKESILHAIDRINELLSANTEIYGFKPKSKWFGVYKIIVKVTSSLIIINLGMFIVYIIKKFPKPRFDNLLSETDNILLIFTAFCVVILSIGEAGEEARFLMSVLPLLAALPVFIEPDSLSIDRK